MTDITDEDLGEYNGEGGAPELGDRVIFVDYSRDGYEKGKEYTVTDLSYADGILWVGCKVGKDSPALMFPDRFELVRRRRHGGTPINHESPNVQAEEEEAGRGVGPDIWKWRYSNGEIAPEPGGDHGGIVIGKNKDMAVHIDSDGRVRVAVRIGHVTRDIVEGRTPYDAWKEAV